MADMISRQAAIEYFVTNVGWHDEDGYPVEDSDELRKIWTDLFNGLPSAQPEQAIKDCRNCKHGRYNDYHKTMFCYNSDDCTDWNLWEPAELPSAQRKGHWIKDEYGAEYCSECLKYPYDDGEYHIANWESDFCPNCGAEMIGEEDESVN